MAVRIDAGIFGQMAINRSKSGSTHTRHSKVPLLVLLGFVSVRCLAIGEGLELLLTWLVVRSCTTIGARMSGVGAA